MEILRNDWQELLEKEFKKDYYLKLSSFLAKEYKSKTIYPNRHDIFNALDYTPYNKVKLVILGQDPYHGYNQAHGLSFSVKPGILPPPSLINIFKELQADLGCYIPNNGYLKKWADQGILLINAVLTVRAGEANSHRNIGWESLTDKIIRLLDEKDDRIIFILWGKNAQSKTNLINNKNHYIIKAPHPSPLSAYRGFFGSKPFSKANIFLNSIGKGAIDWQIENI